MKNTYKVGDWVNACNWKSKIYQNKTFKRLGKVCQIRNRLMSLSD